MPFADPADEFSCSFSESLVKQTLSRVVGTDVSGAGGQLGGHLYGAIDVNVVSLSSVAPLLESICPDLEQIATLRKSLRCRE